MEHKGQKTTGFASLASFYKLAGLLAFALVLIPLLAVSSHAQERLQGFAYPEPTDRFGRIIFEFPRAIKHELEMTPGVLVLKLEEPVSVDVTALPDRMSRYIGAARVDPDGRAIRIALSQALVVNKMEAGEKIFVDLLPATWQGLPPSLPPEVVAELARRAEEAERRAFLEAERKRRLENAPKMSIRVAEAPTFSRISFDWTVNDVRATVSRDGDNVLVRFDVEIDPNLDRLRAQPPKHLEDVSWERVDGGTVISFQVAPEVQVRSFREESSHVVDLSVPISAASQGPPTVVDAAISILQQDGGQDSGSDLLTLDMRTPVPVPPRRPGTERQDRSVTIEQRPMGQLGDLGAIQETVLDEVEPQVELQPQSQPQPQTPASQNAVNPVAATTNPAIDPVAEAMAQDAIRDAEEVIEYAERILDAIDLDDDMVARSEAQAREDAMRLADASSDPAGQSNPVIQNPVQSGSSLAINPVTGLPVNDQRPVRVITTQPQHMAQNTQNGFADEPEVIAQESAPVDGINRARFREIAVARAGNSLRLSVPFENRAPVAVFQRANRLWMVFESNLPIDIRALRNQSGNYLSDIESRRMGDVQLVTAQLVRPLLLTATQSGSEWIITLGDMILEPAAPINLVRGTRSDGGSIIAAEARDVGGVYWFEDDMVGDRIAVVTMSGPVRGFLKDQSFVEFSALSTAHGMVFVPVADDLAVRVNIDEVVISREDGLTISGGAVHQYVPGRRSVGFGARPGQLEYTELVAGNPRLFFDRMRDLMSRAARAEPEEKSAARVELARFLVANDYVLEAIGVMRLAAQDDPLIVHDPAYNIVRGVASALAGRTEEAKRNLSVHGLDRDPDAALWRALVAVEEGEYRAAQLLLDEGRYALNSYPSHVRVRFHLAAVRADIATRDLASALNRLEVLETETMESGLRAESRLHRGRVFELLGRHEEALDAYRAGLEELDDGPVRAESQLRYVALQTQIGRMPHHESIEELERLALSWRGDDIEISTLRTLGQYYVDVGNYRRAFQVLKAAVVANEGSEYTRLFQDEMNRAFVNYFLGDNSERVPALDALALYYDFREMTPIGRQGDEIIRRLADRLVEVDLLAQATELLEYQIDSRLRGAGRSQVASRLAYVHLLNKNAEEALRAIQRTRQTVLPGQLQRERNLLEARALADLGRTQLALELLRTMEGEDANRLAVDTLWQARRWQEAGEETERMLAQAWQGAEPLSDEVRYQVLRGGIAFALAGDDLGLQRYRSKFLNKMSNSPDANAFAVITKPINTASPDFQTVAREIADVDTLQAFLKDFRERYGYAARGSRQDPAPGATGAGSQQRAAID